MTKTELLSDRTPADRGYVARVVKMLGFEVGKAITVRLDETIAPINSRLKATETRIEAEAIDRRLSEINSRLAAVETRTGALAMIAGRGKSGHTTDGIPELENLLRRVAKLEAAGVTMRYTGVWKSNHQYSQGDCVSDHGSCWHCNKSSLARPGESSDWVLIAKRGADGKDAR